MAKVHSKALNKTLETGRIIGHIKGEEPGPCLVFFGGIHGNEPSGVFALHQVISEVQKSDFQVRGSLYALAGNMWALERGERFQRQDLNRLWNVERLSKLDSGTFEPQDEDERELQGIYEAVKEIRAVESSPFYFFDLHTTSGKTDPFMTVNDSLLNRKFTRQYPVPMILGIEEYLGGPLLSYLNELGFVSFGFESGQHDDSASISRHVAFIYLSLVFSGFISKKSISYQSYYTTLGTKSESIFEIYSRYQVKNDEEFKMEPGYENFQKIKKKDLLATSDGKPIHARKNGIIFMPLYQPKGEDGFFTIKKVNPFFLSISTVLRHWKIDRILPILPGITWASPKRQTLKVNLKIALFLTRPILHLLGYRSRRINQNCLLIDSRETASRTDEYRGASWI